ncbi:MAG TPA: nuclear transport factor 2 family protein [Actinomycetota bacterium]|nr:nuclear transport factor 2 family protein [Actinomycetota bacterium]
MTTTASEQRSAEAGTETGVHPNEQFVRDGYAAFNRKDMDAVMGIFADNIRFVVPGRSIQSGTFSGKSEAGRYFQIVGRHTSGTHRLEIQDVVANDDRVLVMARALGERGAELFDMTVVHIWRVEGGKLTELLLFPADQYAFDEFWS